MPVKHRGKSFLFPGISLLSLVIVPLAILSIFGEVSVEANLDALLQADVEQTILGVDDLGRDVVSCLVIGTWISLGIGLTAVVLSAGIGGLLGLVAGLAGGILDAVVMRFVDVMLAFPGILLALTLVAIFPHGALSIICALVVSGWAGYARLVRGEVVKYKKQEFILAARTYNASFGRILFRHLLPLVLPLIVVQASLGIADAIIAESSLNFLGFGLRPEVPTLGQMLDAGRSHLFDRPALVVMPGAVLYVLIVSFSFIGEGLQEYFSRPS